MKNDVCDAICTCCHVCVAIMCYFCVVIMFICGHNDATVHLRCYFYVRLMLIMCYSLLWIMCCSLVSVKFSSSIPCFLSSPAEHSFWIHGFDPGQEWLLTWFEWHTWNHSILARIKTRSGTKPGLPNEPLRFRDRGYSYSRIWTPVLKI